jgi:hypothetical protein
MIIIYVNDLIFTRFNLAAIFWFKNALNERFEMNDLNSCIYYLDMMIFKNRRLKQLILNQSIYVKQILRDHEMWNCKSLIIFMNVSCRLIKIFDEYTADKNLKINYQLIVKSLMYIMLKIRSNITYSISMINRYVFNLTQTHKQALKRIFRYLRETYQMKLMFRETLKSLKSYTNSNWIEDQDIKRSISEYAFNVDNDVINWFSKRQLIVTLSICEIEYTKQILIAKEAIWLRNLMIQLTCNVEYSQTIIIYENNQRIMTLIKNSVSRTNQAHRYSNSLHQRESDRRIHRFSLRVYQSNDSWRSEKIINQRQICSVSRRSKDRIAIVSAERLRDSNLWESINALRGSNQWKLNQVRIWSHHLFLYNSRSLLSVDFAYTERVRKKFLRLYDKFQKVQFRFDFSES